MLLPRTPLAKLTALPQTPPMAGFKRINGEGKERLEKD